VSLKTKPSHTQKKITFEISDISLKNRDNRVSSYLHFQRTLKSQVIKRTNEGILER
jgi:hypothetical protein